VERADAAIVAVRRTLSTGTDPRQGIQDLLTAVHELAASHGIAVPVPEQASGVDATKPDVTESVTESSAADREPIEDEQEATAEVADQPLPARPIGKAETVDLDTVRIERPADFEQTRRWIVLCGTGETERLVGYVCSDGTKSKKWHALGPRLTRVSGGTPCRTRDEALLRLLDSHWPGR
jgi:hypothetical protein